MQRLEEVNSKKKRRQILERWERIPFLLSILWLAWLEKEPHAAYQSEPQDTIQSRGKGRLVSHASTKEQITRLRALLLGDSL